MKHAEKEMQLSVLVIPGLSNTIVDPTPSNPAWCIVTRHKSHSKQYSHCFMFSSTWLIFADKVVLHVAPVVIPLVQVSSAQAVMGGRLVVHHHASLAPTGWLIKVPVSYRQAKETSNVRAMFKTWDNRHHLIRTAVQYYKREWLLFVEKLPWQKWWLKHSLMFIKNSIWSFRCV